jgi:hypothetical protein
MLTARYGRASQRLFDVAAYDVPDGPAAAILAQAGTKTFDGEAEPDGLRRSWIRGAVAGYLGHAKATSDTPGALAHKDGHAYGSRLREQLEATG